MRHGFFYCGPFEENEHLLRVGARSETPATYRKKKGKTGIVSRPNVTGIAFGYMQDSGANVFYAVSAGNVLLNAPIHVGDGGLRISFAGKTKGFGPVGPEIDDESAERLVHEMAAKNPLKKKALLALLEQLDSEDIHGVEVAPSSVHPGEAPILGSDGMIPDAEVAVDIASPREVKLPEPVSAFLDRIAAVGATEIERLGKQRIGQDLFREQLLEYWEGRCAVTGLAEPKLLRASHIKPWAKCDTDAERLDVFNGLLLAPHLDAAFDSGFITVADNGEVLVSERLGGEARALLGLNGALRVRSLEERHRRFLAWHRLEQFR